MTIEKLGITPGPWVKWNDEHTSGGLDIVISGKDTIGFIYSEKEPDARLIAQAPAMLEALVELLCNCDDEYFRLPKEDTDKWRVIIESATGKTWDEIKELIK